MPDSRDLFVELPILNEIGEEIERILAVEEESSRRPHSTEGEPRRLRFGARHTGARWWRARPLALVLALVVGGTGVAYASGLFSFGAPVKSTPVFSNADVGLGAVTPGSVKVLAVATPDPRGGPPWGLRVLTTTRDAGCVEVGRVVDGQLVALGQYGAFGNDGRAHRMPVSAAVNSFNCTPLDSKGHFVDSVSMIGQTASAAFWFRSTQCVPTGTPRSTSRAHPACPLREERDLYYGLLGPDAKSITYTIAGQRHTQATVGAQGAYLIVTGAAAHQRIPGAGGATDDDVPVYSPITSIEYRGGATCHLLTAHKWIVGFHACSPALNVPLGYVRAVAPTQAQIATPIHSQLTRIPARVVRYPLSPGSSATRVIHVPASHELTVRFKSRITLKNLRGQYQIAYHAPGTPAQSEGFITMGTAQAVSEPGDPILGPDGTGSDITAGQTVTGTTMVGFGLHEPVGATLKPGLLRGRVILDYSTGPALDGDLPTQKITVGTFTVKIP
jgi:hypothetical protein